MMSCDVMSCDGTWIIKIHHVLQYLCFIYPTCHYIKVIHKYHNTDKSYKVSNTEHPTRSVTYGITLIHKYHNTQKSYKVRYLWNHIDTQISQHSKILQGQLLMESH
uniref:Uncharacterized protein n=1 Tax=Grenadier adomavirus TaxID=2609868 RepID=A0A6F9EYL6_9VIRU|nr:TPA_asm: hypothetical protein [Grenadier adomavirus]